jgi:hypothetical protein
MVFLRYYLWIAPNLLIGVLWLLVLRRHLYRQLLSFAVYLTVQLAIFLVSVILRLQSPVPVNLYRWMVLILGGGLLTCSELWVIYELWNKLVFSRSSLARFGRIALSAVLALLVLGSAAASGTFSDISAHHVMNVYQSLDFSSSLIGAGMLFTLFAFARFLGLSWRNWMVGTALGFGVSACIDLASAACRASFGKTAFVPVDITQMVAFHIGVLVWLAYLLAPQPAAHLAGAGLPRAQMDIWNDELQKIVHG